MAVQPVSPYRMRLTYDQIRADIQELKQRIRRLENSVSGGLSSGVGSASPAGGDMLKSVYDTDVNDQVDNVGLIDPTSSFVLDMALVANSILADRTLTWDVDDADRTLTISADIALNQNLRTTDSPQLAGLTLTGNLTLGLNTLIMSDVSLAWGAANRLDLATGDDLNLVSGVYMVAGTQVLTSRQVAIADVVVAGAAQDPVARAAINTILAMLRTHGLIAP